MQPKIFLVIEFQCSNFSITKNKIVQITYFRIATYSYFWFQNFKTVEFGNKWCFDSDVPQK